MDKEPTKQTRRQPEGCSYIKAVFGDLSSSSAHRNLSNAHDGTPQNYARMISESVWGLLKYDTWQYVFTVL
jgi:hypothetical protein